MAFLYSLSGLIQTSALVPDASLGGCLISKSQSENHGKECVAGESLGEGGWKQGQPWWLRAKRYFCLFGRSCAEPALCWALDGPGASTKFKS